MLSCEPREVGDEFVTKKFSNASAGCAYHLSVQKTKAELELLREAAEVRYEVPASEPAVLTNMGIPLDEVEDLLLESAAYRQADFIGLLLSLQQGCRD